MKKSFTLLEMILTVLLISFLYTLFIPQLKTNNIHELKNRIVLQLKHLRHKALSDNKYNQNIKKWHKQRWTFKFFNCDYNVDGLYYVMYSDTNMTGIPAKSESLKDPLSNKYIYSSNQCKETNENSKYVLLSKSFEIDDVSVTCNNTDSIGQISFGNDGRVYSKLSNENNGSNEYEIRERCEITLFNKEKENIHIIIEPKTGYIY